MAFPPAVDGTEQRLDAILTVLTDIRDRLPAPAPARGDGTTELREPATPAAPAAPAGQEPAAPLLQEPAKRSRPPAARKPRAPKQ